MGREGRGAGDADGALSLRAGYNYGKMPLDPDRAFENLAFPAVSEHHVTAGAGYAFSDRLAVNVAWVYALNAKLEGANAAPPPPMGGTGQALRTDGDVAARADMGLCYRF